MQSLCWEWVVFVFFFTQKCAYTPCTKKLCIAHFESVYFDNWLFLKIVDPCKWFMVYGPRLLIINDLGSTSILRNKPLSKESVCESESECANEIAESVSVCCEWESELQKSIELDPSCGLRNANPWQC